MILFGAGSSVPFEVPGMVEFTEEFVAKHKEISRLINNIKDAIVKSDETIGISFSFDLETLMSVLNDLSSFRPNKPISIATASMLLREGLNIKAAREKYGSEASSAFDTLRQFIFRKCMHPIEKGKKEGNFRFLDRFFGPLMTVLNKTGLENVQGSVRKIYSTNWDLCFKTWVDYINVPIDDRVAIDRQSLPVLSVGEKRTVASGFTYWPLHGSIDFIKIPRLKGEGTYDEIFKIPDPIGYFKDKPDNIREVFMIYPLEAIGYEESVKSPYLDMLNSFRTSLREEEVIFIIGYSLRDPTIGSIFEEVIAERIRKGDLTPLSENLDSRKNGIPQHRFKIILINPKPNKLAKNLKKRFNTNLLQTFIPIKIEFPKVTDEQFDKKYTQVLSQLIIDLVHIRYMGVNGAESTANILNSRYGLSILVRDFPWKKKQS